MKADDIIKLILNFFELIATVAGFYYIRKWKSSHWRWLPYFLLFTFITELVGKYFYFNLPIRQYNYIVFRYVNIPVTFLFYFWLVYHSFSGKNLRRAVPLVAVLYILEWLVEEFYLRGKFSKNSIISYSTAVCCLLIFIISWFVKLVQSRQLLYFKRNLYFWIFSGILIYYIITLPIRALGGSLYERYPDIYMVGWYISFIFNCIMYILFTAGIKWADPKSSYSL